MLSPAHNKLKKNLSKYSLLLFIIHTNFLILIANNQTVLIPRYFHEQIQLPFSFQVPHLFLDGKHIGGEPEIKRLHESGEMRRIFKEAGL